VKKLNASDQGSPLSCTSIATRFRCDNMAKARPRHCSARIACRPFQQSRQRRVVVVTVTQSRVANGMCTPYLAGRVVRI